MSDDHPGDKDPSPAPLKFCASPWVEGVLRTDRADTKICCKNPLSLGSWKNGGISKAWHSSKAVQLREEISAGRFPDEFCRACYGNDTTMKLGQLLNKPMNEYLRLFHMHAPEDTGKMASIRILFEKKEMDEQAVRVLDRFRGLRDEHQVRAEQQGQAEYLLACEKLGVIANILEDFLRGETRPREVAPFRQVTLIAVCNARCIQCKGKFTGEIEDGIKQEDGEMFRWMTWDQFEDAMSASDSIIDYFTSGSETLFHKDWHSVGERLREEGVRLRVSTNGMLLTPDHVDNMIDKDFIGKLNISLDGATPETIEKIRVRVKYDRVMRNIKYLLDRLEREQIHLPISFSFVVMKDNYAEIPVLLDLVHGLWEGRDLPAAPVILFQAMGQSGPETYGEFISQHHHSVVPYEKLKAAFVEAGEKATEYGINTFVFTNRSIQDFVAAGCPVPKLDFQVAVVNFLEEA